MSPKVTSLELVLRLVEPHADRRLVQAAARELLDIIEAAALADQRRLEAADTARKVQRLRNQGLPRRAIVARLGISASQYQRACQANSSRLR